jgi:hypothetical protein
MLDAKGPNVLTQEQNSKCGMEATPPPPPIIWLCNVFGQSTTENVAKRQDSMTRFLQNLTFPWLSHMYPEDGGSRMLRNVGNHKTKYTVS